MQTLRYSEATNTRVPRTYLVDGPSGMGALISETLPEIASFFDHGYVALMEDPFPRVEIRRYTDQITERLPSPTPAWGPSIPCGKAIEPALRGSCARVPT